MTREIVEVDEFRHDPNAVTGDYTLTLLGEDGTRRDVRVSGVTLKEAYVSAPEHFKPGETLLGVQAL